MLKKSNLTILFYLAIVNCVKGQMIQDRIQGVHFTFNQIKLNDENKRYIDSLAVKFEENKKTFDAKIHIKKVKLISLVCEEEKSDSTIQNERFGNVAKYMRKKFKSKIPEFELLPRTDYYPQCDSYDHGVRILIILK